MTFISGFKFAINKQNRKIWSRQEKKRFGFSEVAFVPKNAVTGKNGSMFFIQRL